MKVKINHTGDYLVSETQMIWHLHSWETITLSKGSIIMVKPGCDRIHTLKEMAFYRKLGVADENGFLEYQSNAHTKEDKDG